MQFIVAIDGPAGSGKGTITKRISNKLNLINIDTGAMYRCVALECINRGLSLSQKEKIIEISKQIKIELKDDEKIYLNNEDVTKEIRSKEVSKIVSQVSAIVEVRYNMVKLQRKLAEGKKVIMEGRDITTYVFPNADVKIYLDASLEERAKRRYKEIKDNGQDITYKEVLNNIKMRDENDRHKKVGSLKIAPDAVLIDTTNLTIDEVEEKVIKIIKEKSL